MFWYNVKRKKKGSSHFEFMSAWMGPQWQCQKWSGPVGLGFITGAVEHGMRDPQ